MVPRQSPANRGEGLAIASIRAVIGSSATTLDAKGRLEKTLVCGPARGTARHTQTKTPPRLPAETRSARRRQIRGALAP